jgi:DNA (cytosine-5)-methyltransferase 1
VALRTISICSGIGGLDLGFHRAFPESRTVLYVEREVYPVAVMAARMADGLLDEAPVWSDLTTFDGAAWRGSVDCLIGGIPCQPFSVAGKRQGTDDERWLWDDVLRIIRDTECRVVGLENVPGFVRYGLPIVLRDLAELGFDAAWRVVSAASVGAPHIRKRVFVLAYCDGERQPQPQWSRAEQWRGTQYGGEGMAHAGCPGQNGIQHSTGASGTEANPGGDGEVMADSDGAHAAADGCAVGVRAEHAWPRLNGTDMEYAGCLTEPEPGNQANAVVTCRNARARSGWGHGDLDPGFPPSPDDTPAWRRILTERPDLAPATQPPLRGVADESSARMDELRALGNGVVPRQAEWAFRQLRRDLGV